MDERKTELVLILCMICFLLGWHKDFFDINKLVSHPSSEYEELVWTEEKSTVSAFDEAYESPQKEFLEESDFNTTEDAVIKPTPSPKPKVIKPSLCYEGATVYVTKSGTKFHRPDCSSLSKSKIEMLYEDATGKGYEPCGKCKP